MKNKKTDKIFENWNFLAPFHEVYLRNGKR
jgi:hypothetical protein